MSTHGLEHEERLAMLLSGERRANDPEAVRWLAECARCRDRWEALQSVSATLEEAGATQRAALAAGARTTPAPGEERVLATLERLSRSEARVTRRAIWPFAAVAAAVLLLLGAWMVVRFFEREGERPLWLGSGGLVPIAPVGQVEDFRRFEWQYSGDAAHYTLRIREAKDGRILHEVARWTEKTWETPPEVSAKLGERIYWEVEAFDPSDVSQSAAQAGAPAWSSSD